MFDQEFASETTLVRVVALTGKKGQPPLLWEGLPSTDTATVIRQISRNKRVASHALPGYRFIVRGRRRGRNLGEEIVIRSFDLVERVLLLIAQMVHERDVVVGRVAEVGLRRVSERVVAPPAEPSSGDALAQIVESMPKLMEMVESFRKARRQGSSTE